MAKRRGKIGEVFVEVVAKTLGLKKGLKEAEQQTAKSARAMGKDAESMSDKFQQTLSPLTKMQALLSTLFIPLTVFASLAGYFLKWKQIREQATAFKLELDTISSSSLRASRQFVSDLSSTAAGLQGITQQFGDMNQQIEQLGQKRINKAGTLGGSIVRALLGGQTPEEIRQAMNAARVIVGASLTRSREEFTRKEIENAQRINDELSDKLDKPSEAVVSRAKRQIDAIRRELEQATNDNLREELRKRINLIQRVAAEERRRLVELEGAAERAAKKQAQAFADAIEKSLATALSRGIAVGEAKMSRLVIAAETMVSSVERLRRRINP